jgi:hypothetical protein
MIARIPNPRVGKPSNGLPEPGAFPVANPRIHLKWNSGFDPSFGVLRRFRFKAGDHSNAIRRTRRDAAGSGWPVENQQFWIATRGPMRRKKYRQATDEDGGRRDTNRRICSISPAITS